jgi:hypothetical protein
MEDNDKPQSDDKREYQRSDGKETVPRHPEGFTEEAAWDFLKSNKLLGPFKIPANAFPPMSTPLFCECDRCKAYLELKVRLPYLFFAVANLTKGKDRSTSGKGLLALRKAMTGMEDIGIAAIRREVLTNRRDERG